MPDHREEKLAAIVGMWRERVERGEDVDPEAFAREHPELAESLRARIAAAGLLEQRLSAGRGRVPASIGEYRIVREIGRGGMGVVYEAEQTSMRRRVALKVLFPSVTSTPEAVTRFCREAWAAGRVKHTNIVAVHQLGQDRGTWFCAMELVEGRPLSRVIEELRHERKALRESRLARRARGLTTPSPLLAETATGTRAYYLRVAEMFAEVAEALQLAHDHGILHRDVKPSNLLLDSEGRLKVADFGLARLQGAAATVTRTGGIVGTPLYMSPEQVAGRRDMDGRTDVYSLGATLYETLTLRPPFRAETVAGLAAEVVGREPPAPRRSDGQIPKDLETIVLKALEKNAASRYRSAADLARDLRAFAHGGLIHARRVGPIGRIVRRVRRNKVRVALAAAVLLAVAVAAAFGVRESRERDRRADLEYEHLCLEADQALARGTAWAEGGRDGMLGADVAPGPTAAEILDTAIRVRPNRPDAYFIRALASGRTKEERLADIEAAGVRGLAERPWRLAKAALLADAGRTADAEAEERLAAQAGPANASTLLAEGLLAKRRGDRKRALERISGSLALADSPASVRCRALWWRSVLLEEAGDLEGAAADLHALRVWTGQSIVSIRIASLRRRLGHEADAEALFTEDLKRAEDLGSEEIWRATAQQCWDSREYAWLERVAASGLLRHPGSAELHYGRGLALAGLGRPEEALAEFDCTIGLDPNMARAHNSRGAVLHDRLRRPAEALAEFDRAIELDPNYAMAHANRGTALVTLGRPGEALADLDRALGLDANLARAHSNRGCALAKLGRPAEALAEFDRGIELDPKDANAHTNRGVALSRLGRPDEALAAHDRAIELDPKNAPALANRGTVLLGLGRLGEALAACDRALEFDPENAGARFNRGCTLVQLGRPEEALAEFDRAIELDPKDANAHNQRGNTLLGLGRPGEALDAFDRVIEFDPTDADAHINRGAALLRLRRPDEALAAFDRAIELDPKNMAAHTNRATALLGLGRPSEALAAFDRAIQLDPMLATAHCNRGVTLSKLGRPEEALAEFDRAIELDPKDANAHNKRGGALLGLGRPGEALDAFDRVIELNPTDATAHTNRGAALSRLGRLGEALDACDRAIELNPMFGDTHSIRAITLVRLGRLEEALAELDRAIELNPKNAMAHSNRGNVLLELGRPGEALDACDRAIELDPKLVRAHYGRGVTLRTLGRLKEAMAAFERAAELGRDPASLNDMAWQRATDPDPNVRDPARAVGLARRAVEIAPSEGGYWNTLGVALCRAGRWAEALEALGKSMSLRNGGDAFDLFFVAIAQWHLSRENEARTSYEKAIAWAEANAPDDKELKRFREEAAALMGDK